MPFLCMAFGSFAQKTIPLKDILYYGGIEINKPVICDSVNVRNEKFEWQTMLKTQLNEPMEQSRYKTLKIGEDSAFVAEKPSKGYQLSLWKFYIMPENFMPLKLELKSTNAFEVYVDGVKNTEKKTRENTKEKAGKVTIDLKADPRQYQVLVKMLSAATDSCDLNFSVGVKTEKRDSSVQNILTASDRRLLFTPDFLLGKRIANVGTSPNGRYALIDYNVVFKDGSKSSISELVYLISGEVMWSLDSNIRKMRWMPKTNALYYTLKGLEGKELHVFNPVTQQEKIVVKNLPDAEFVWSPRENFLICSVSDTTPDNKSELQRLINPEDRQDGYRNRSSLFMYDLNTGLYSRLTYGKENASLHDISADEKQLLFGTRIQFIPKAPFSETNLYLLHLETMKVDTIWQHDKFAIDAVFSPDGKKLLIKGAPESFEGIGQNISAGQIANPFDIQAYIMDLKTKEVECITRDFNPSIVESVWNKNDGLIYFTAEDKDFVRIYSYNPEIKSFHLFPVTPDVVTHFDVATEAKNMVYFGSTVNYTGKVYTQDLKKYVEKTVTDPCAERFNKVDTGKVEDWDFQSTDGTTIYGRYYLPPSFDPSKKYPVLVYYYGGTSPTSRAFESNYPLNLYAAMGYVVYTLQPSGTTGFGQEFSARHVNAWGDKTADEIILGTKLFCRQHAFADSTKLGCFGASYGGFMTMYLQTKTDIFKAAVSHAGISNIASYWGQGYWGYSYNTAAASGSYPWNNPQLYTDHSPLFHADKVNTPLLLLQGSVDTNVPIGESIQMYTALKMLGKPVEFIKVEGENHSIKNFQRKLEWQRTILAWFAKYLKEDDRWWNELYKPGALDN